AWTYTDEEIIACIEPAGVDAVAKGAAARHATRLLGLLAELGPTTREDLRRRMSVSGATLEKTLGPLMAALRITRQTVQRPDSRGRQLDVELFSLVPGQIGLSGTVPREA